jgi:hypothetical protein
MNKRGTHVEVIISFIIFVVFLVFILIASKPSITKQEDKKNLFDSLEFKIMEDVSSDMTAVTISIEDNVEEWVTLDKTINDLGIEGNVIVKDSSGAHVDAYLSGDSITIRRINPLDTLFKIYYSEEFGELNPIGARPTRATNIGLTKTNEYVFEEKVRALIADNYETLKTEFNVPKDMNFGYGITLSDGTIVETTPEDLRTNISTSVYVRETQIEYVNTEGDILLGYLRMKIW